MLRATTASKQFTRHAGANPRPQASSSSNDAPTKRNQPDTPNTSRPLRGSTGLREHNTRKTRKQGRTQPHKSGTPGDHTYSDPHQSRVIHHTSNNTPIPSTHLIPVSFESLRRRRWRWRRRRRTSRKGRRKTSAVYSVSLTQKDSFRVVYLDRQHNRRRRWRWRKVTTT